MFYQSGLSPCLTWGSWGSTSSRSTQRVRSWPGGTRVTSSNITYRTMESLRGKMLGYGMGRSSLQGVEDLTGRA